MSRSDSPSWRSRVVAPGTVAFMVLCCVAAPLVVGAAGALTLGATLGLAAGLVALAARCLDAARRLRGDRGGC